MSCFHIASNVFHITIARLPLKKILPTELSKIYRRHFPQSISRTFVSNLSLLQLHVYE